MEIFLVVTWVMVMEMMEYQNGVEVKIIEKREKEWKHARGSKKW